MKVNIKDKQGESALFIAVKRRHHKCVRELISRGAEVNLTNLYTPLDIARILKDDECEKLLLQYGAHSREDGFKRRADGNKRERPPLVEAAKWGNIEKVRQLLSNGADVNEVTTKNRNALYNAAKWGHVECVREILRYNPDIDLIDCR